MDTGTRRGRRAPQRSPGWLQTAAFVGAVLLIALVVYTATVSRRNRRVEERLAVTAVARQKESATAAVRATVGAQRTATAHLLDSRRSTPVAIPGQAISAENAGQVGELARWGKGVINGVAWSPDGRLLAVATSIGVYLYDPWRQQEVRYLETSAPIWHVAFSPDGRTLAAAAPEDRMWRWQAAEGTLTAFQESPPGLIRSIHFAPDGSLIVVGVDWETQRIWVWKAGDRVVAWIPWPQVPGQPMLFSPAGLAVSPDGQFLAVGWWDASPLELRRVADGTPVATFRGETGPVTRLDFSPDGQTLAIVSGDSAVRLWRVPDGTLLRTLESEMGAYTGLRFSPDGQLLACVGERSVRIWRIEDGWLVQRLEGRFGPSPPSYLGAQSMAFSPDGRLLAAACPGQGHLSLWNIADGALFFSQPEFSLPMVGLVFPRDAQTLAAAADDGTVWFWGTANGTVRQVLGNPYGGSLPEGAGGLATSRDGRLVAIGGSEGRVQLWDWADNSLWRELPGPVDVLEYGWYGYAPPVASVDLAPDGSAAAAGLDDGTILFWEIGESTRLQVLSPSRSATGFRPTVAFSPDGQVLAAAYSMTVRLWRTADRTPLKALEEHTDWITDLAFSPDGRLLATGAQRDGVFLWRMPEGTLLRKVETEGRGTVAVTFSPDGQILATGSFDGLVQLWRVADDTLLRTLVGHTQWPQGLAFSPDGRMLGTTSSDGTIRLWGVVR